MKLDRFWAQGLLACWFCCGTVVLAQGAGAPVAPDSAIPTETQGAGEDRNSLAAGMRELSALQAMLEFFFMEAGVYPGELNELSAVFNYQLPKGASAVIIPTDPATAKAFVYSPAANRKGYRLGFPQPAKYGLSSPVELGPVSWGWLALRAERKRFEELAKLSKYHMETLATEIEMYAKDNSGVYPKTLDALFPTYIKRHPQDPITGKNYDYKQLADGYLIISPNPERYGLKVFQYSSSRGMLVEAAPPASDKR